jgi:hypothetical protein
LRVYDRVHDEMQDETAALRDGQSTPKPVVGISARGPQATAVTSVEPSTALGEEAVR